MRKTLSFPDFASTLRIAPAELMLQFNDLDAMPAEVEYKLMVKATCILQFILLRELRNKDRDEMIKYLEGLWSKKELRNYLQGGRHSLPGVINQYRMCSLIGAVIDTDPHYCKIQKRDMAHHLACHHGLDLVPFNPFFLSEDSMLERMSRSKYLNEVASLIF